MTDLEQRVLQIRRAHESERPKAAIPAWLNAHNDILVVFAYIDELRAGYASALEENQDLYRGLTATPDIALGALKRLIAVNKAPAPDFSGSPSDDDIAIMIEYNDAFEYAEQIVGAIEGIATVKDDERSQFEAYFSGACFQRNKPALPCDYFDSVVENLWDGWKARAALACNIDDGTYDDDAVS